MAAVAKGKQGRVRKWASDGRLRTNRLERKLEHGQAGWNELLGTPEKRERTKPKLVFVTDTDTAQALASLAGDPEAVEAMGASGEAFCRDSDADSDGVADYDAAAEQGDNEYPGYKRDEHPNFGKCQRYIPFSRWENLLWDQGEEHQSKRAKKLTYLPPNPVFWKLPLPWYWRERYRELSAKYPLIIAFNFSNTFSALKSCQFTVSVCQTYCLSPYRPLFCTMGFRKKRVIGHQKLPTRGEFLPEKRQGFSRAPISERTNNYDN